MRELARRQREPYRRAMRILYELKQRPQSSYKIASALGIRETTVAHVLHWAEGHGLAAQTGDTTRRGKPIYRLTHPVDMVKINCPTCARSIEVPLNAQHRN